MDMPPLQASKYQPTRPNVRACYTSQKSHGTENNGMKITHLCDVITTPWHNCSTKPWPTSHHFNILAIFAKQSHWRSFCLCSWGCNYNSRDFHQLWNWAGLPIIQPQSISNSAYKKVMKKELTVHIIFQEHAKAAIDIDCILRQKMQ